MTILEIIKEKFPIGSTMTLWTREPKRGLGRLKFQQSPHFCKEIDLIVKDIIFVPNSYEPVEGVSNSYFKILFTSGHEMFLDEY